MSAKRFDTGPGETSDYPVQVRMTLKERARFTALSRHLRETKSELVRRLLAEERQRVFDRGERDKRQLRHLERELESQVATESDGA